MEHSVRPYEVLGDKRILAGSDGANHSFLTISA
jgi:hypothetical protein